MNKGIDEEYDIRFSDLSTGLKIAVVLAWISGILILSSFLIGYIGTVLIYG